MASRSRFMTLTLVLAALAAFSVRALFPAAGWKGRLLSPGFAGKVVEIVMLGPREGFPLVFTIREGRWMLVFDSSRYYPANSERIEGLLRALSGRRRVRRLNAGDTHAYGTDGPGRCQITLRTTSAEKTISFGAENADGRLRYARRAAESAILALDGDISPWLDNATAPWLDRSPFAHISQTSTTRATAYGRGMFIPLERGERLDGVVGLISGISVADITNIPLEPSFRVRLERGDLSVSVLAFALLDARYGTVTDETSGLSWILPADRVQEILLAFQHFSAM